MHRSPHTDSKRKVINKQPVPPDLWCFFFRQRICAIENVEKLTNREQQYLNIPKNRPGSPTNHGRNKTTDGAQNLGNHTKVARPKRRNCPSCKGTEMTVRHSHISSRALRKPQREKDSTENDKKDSIRKELRFFQEIAEQYNILSE